MMRRGSSGSVPASLRVALAATLALAAPPGAAQLPASAAAEQRYDIPAQTLAAALSTYARVSGVDILYENALGAGRMSAPVHGTMSSPAALRALLAGTGLSARFTQPRAAIVYLTGAPASNAAATELSVTRLGRDAGMPRLRLDLAEVRAPMLIGSPDRSGYERYAQAAQLEIVRILGDDPQLKHRPLRLSMSLAVTPEGQIRRVTVMQGSADSRWDSRIRQRLLGRALPPPPPGLRDTLHFEVKTNRAEARD